MQEVDCVSLLGGEAHDPVVALPLAPAAPLAPLAPAAPFALVVRILTGELAEWELSV